jgi:ribosome biogenesis GTPase
VQSGIVGGLRTLNQWRVFNILNTDRESQIEAFLDRELPSDLWEQIVIGDVVFYMKKDGEFYILKRGERKNKLTRLKGDNDRFSMWKRVEQCIASNIDLWIIVASAQDPDFHPNFVDRYNVLLQYWNVNPLICITKGDLKQINDPVLNWYHKELWIKVIYCSTVTWSGMEELKKEIAGKTVVLVWNSWVGKSSLINHLVGDPQIKTQTVGIKNWQGRHTTTSSSMYEWSEWSYIIDTPGIRSLELLEIAQNELRLYYRDFIALSEGCQYNDCTHTHEPICWVKEAVKNWSLAKERYESYLRIYNSLI